MSSGMSYTPVVYPTPNYLVDMSNSLGVMSGWCPGCSCAHDLSSLSTYVIVIVSHS